ncbi:3D (Asp-Asp-Asp) domain-containing protein [Aneurinibacillus soli]|uniref:Cell wall-binding protein YocH n=1 Tax=Aneurinibacillus soli TaxID=1500254 RepID=A0A0U5B906_9BACL|nr:3D domain-containing protein [Aneurinibacillus soli]PYE59315.1 3D (Asp-Asp-Asp) domain-containing protein [Aneurinibacillus soli]BAU26695.1 Cell wall-binding protein YocH precursor [Aneurinibacillus soli]
MQKIKNMSLSVFRKPHSHKGNRWPLLIGIPVIALFLLIHTVNSLAEAPQSTGEHISTELQHQSETSFLLTPLQNGEASAKELVSLGLAYGTPSDIVTIASRSSKAKERALSQRKKKTSRSEMRQAREGMVFTANASGYTGPGKTKLGTKVRPGIVAVDPDYIPLGTVLWVEGYGTCRAEDTGGAIKGNAIDLVFATTEDANAWGRKDVQVRVMKLPE